ncbi:MAG TPA: oxidoreductase [Bacteroidales bacterium]|nr:oxidoreductase [Bacteroidales bacterium]
MSWTTEDIPVQDGKIIVVTGANSGLGYWTTYHLAKRHAEVVMACRNTSKANEAADKIRKDFPSARLDIMELDLADIESIKRFSEAFHKKYKQLNILINNAGVMAIPERRTKQGFEMQFGTNHLGHFVLTSLLFDLIKKTRGSRVVTLSSLMHKRGEIRFEDLNWDSDYSKWKAYGQSKLANLLFMLELEKKIKSSGNSVISVASHPGWASTNLQAKGPEMEGSNIGLWLNNLGNNLLAQSAEMGAMPTLYAATSHDVTGGKYYGPSGFGGLRGYPHEENINAEKADMKVADRLWKESEKLSGINFSIN